MANLAAGKRVISLPWPRSLMLRNQISLPLLERTLSFLEQSLLKPFPRSMSSLCTRSLRIRNLIRYRTFSSTLEQTHFTSHPIHSISQSHSIKATYCFGSLAQTATGSIKTSFLRFRTNHSMASQSTQPQSVHDFTVKVRLC